MKQLLTRAQVDALLAPVDGNRPQREYMALVGITNRVREIYLRSERRWSVGGVALTFRSQADAEAFRAVVGGS